MYTLVFIASLVVMSGVNSSPLDRTSYRGLLNYLLKRTEETCTYHGNILNVGESYPADGTCPSCSCHEGGHLACTLCAAELEKVEITCSYKDKTLHVGESYPADGSCPSCSCHEGGYLACSSCFASEVLEETCTYKGNMLKVGESYPLDGICPCTCHSGGHMACPACSSTTRICFHGGETYDEGESWLLFVPGGDCQRCTCLNKTGVECVNTECPTRK